MRLIDADKFLDDMRKEVDPEFHEYMNTLPISESTKVFSMIDRLIYIAPTVRNKYSTKNKKMFALFGTIVERLDKEEYWDYETKCKNCGCIWIAYEYSVDGPFDEPPDLVSNFCPQCGRKVKEMDISIDLFNERGVELFASGHSNDNE